MPNWTFRPSTSESVWTSNRAEAPGICSTPPEIELRNPWTQATVAVMSAVSLVEAPSERVFVVIPGAWTLKSVAVVGIGFVL